MARAKRRDRLARRNICFVGPDQLSPEPVIRVTGQGEIPIRKPLQEFLEHMFRGLWARTESVLRGPLFQRRLGLNWVPEFEVAPGVLNLRAITEAVVNCYPRVMWTAETLTGEFIKICKRQAAENDMAYSRHLSAFRPTATVPRRRPVAAARTAQTLPFAIHVAARRKVDLTLRVDQRTTGTFTVPPEIIRQAAARNSTAFIIEWLRDQMNRQAGNIVSVANSPRDGCPYIAVTSTTNAAHQAAIRRNYGGQVNPNGIRPAEPFQFDNVTAVITAMNRAIARHR